MPVVELTRDPRVVSDEVIRSLLDVLPGLVVEALGTPETPITVQDVDIRVRTPGRFEVTEFDLQIMVSASYTEARYRDIDERHQRLLEAVQEQAGLPAGVRAYLWLTLPRAKFGEFTA